MSIFKDIKNSVYSPQFYSHIITGSGSKAFWYFIKFNLLLVAVVTVIAGAILIPLAMTFLSQENVSSISSYYPQDLEVVVKKGIVSTNVTEPYAIAMPEKWTSEKPSSDEPKNLLVINTKAPFTIESFDAYDTVVLLTKDSLVARDDNKGKLTIQKLEDLNVTINRAQINTWTTSIVPFLKVIIPFVLVGLAIGLFLLILISKLFLIAIGAVLLFIAGKITKSSVTYSQWFKIGLYAVTPLILIEIIALALGIDLAWYVSLLILIISVFVNTRPH
ncbi:MAG: DUF1189 family protein [Patescibacteria group bacterium]